MTNITKLSKAKIMMRDKGGGRSGVNMTGKDVTVLGFS